MKKISFLTLILLIALSTKSQITIKVIDSLNMEPLHRATISLIDGKTDFTNSDGNLTIPLRKNEMATLKISAIGYTTKFITTDTLYNYVIKLNRSKVFMPSIEINAVRAGKNYPFTQSLISKKDISSKNLGQDIPILLNQVPGVVVNSDAGNGIGYTGMRIRGTDATRINITLNGIPYNDAESQGVYFVNLPDLISSTNSIQVQRGVGTSSNGTGSFGGTINILTNEVQPLPYATISKSYGSFNSNKNTIKAGTGLINDQYTFDIRLSAINSDGYIDRSKTDLKSFYISTASIKEKSSFRLNIFSGKEKTYQAWYGIPEDQLTSKRRENSAGTEKPGAPYDNETDNYTQTHYQAFYNKKINSKWNFNNASYLTKGYGYYEQYKADQEFSNYGLANPQINGIEIHATDLIRQLWLSNQLIGDNFSMQFKDEDKEIMIGGGVSHYHGNHFGKVIWSNIGIPKEYTWYDLTANKYESHFFTKWLQKLGSNTNLFGDIQVRDVHYKINGFRDNPSLFINKSWTFINPKMGLSKKLGKYNLYLSYAMANKEPNRDDFESGITQQPKVEKLGDYEMGIERVAGVNKFSATAYYMDYTDQLILTGKINDVGAYTRSNVSKSFRAGIELEGNLTILKWLRIDNNLSLSKNKIKNYTEYYDDYDAGGQKSNFYKKPDISFSPSIIGNSIIKLDITKSLHLNLTSKYVSRQYLDNTSRKDRSLNPYFIQDLQINHQLIVRNTKSIDLSMQVNNIWNKLYEPNGYTYSYLYEGEISKNNYYFPMAGTNIMAGITINF